MGAGPFSDIPSDIFSQITHFSSLQSITRLGQACKRFAEYILCDKRVWIECLRRDVVANGIKLPKYRRSLADASAMDVRSWVSIAISLHRAYASGRQDPKVHSFVVDSELETTWAKIVRGRWYLAAMSNTFQSFIGIWGIRSDGTLEVKHKFYLPGPILDGAVDDGIEKVHIAFTIASTNPYIQILALGMKGDKPHLIPLQRLEGARHVLLLNGSIVGYGTLLGDDTYPLLTDWRTCATVRLIPALYNNNPHMLLGDIHSACHAIGIWRNYVFAVLNYSVEIFLFPSFESFPPALDYHLGFQSLFFPIVRDDCEDGWVGEAFIDEAHQLPPDIVPNTKESALRVSIRDRSKSTFVLTIMQLPGDHEFSWQTTTCDDALSLGTLKLCVANEYLLQLSLTCHTVYPIILEVARINRMASKEESVAQHDNNQGAVPLLSTPELLVLDSTTAMDFDDTAGVVLLGNCRGEIQVIQLTDSSLHTRGSLLDDLPPFRADLKGLVQAQIPLDLPYCYYLSDKIHERIVPSVVQEEAIENWSLSPGFTIISPSLGWSSDWKRNASTQNWVLPFPRWRTQSVDKQFHVFETWNRFIRCRLGSRGDMIPIMYHERKHDFVIFRIARRVYLFNIGPYGQDDEHRMRALPYSTQDLSNPAVLWTVEQERWYSGTLGMRHHRYEETMLSDLTEGYSCLLNFLKTDLGRMELTDRSLTGDPRTWKPTDRTEMQDLVRGRWFMEHQRMNERAEYGEDDCY